MKKLIEGLKTTFKCVRIALLVLLISFIVLLFFVVLTRSADAAYITPTLAPDGEEWNATQTAQVEPTKKPHKPTKTPEPTPTIYITYTPEPYPAPELDSWFDELLDSLGIKFK